MPSVQLPSIQPLVHRENTASALATQWTNPTDVSTILMIIGGDVVQKALAQGTGKLYTPVCFSFGCVAYAFTALIGILGDGRLLPPPDYPVRVFNLESGYSKENRNWVLGRILRDLEAQTAKELPHGEPPYGLCISVFEAVDNPNGPTQFSWGRVHFVSLAITLLQFGIATVPAIPAVGGDWSVLFITAVGTLLIQMIGLLPQWVAEKLPNRQHARGTYALTAGNGSRDIIVIIGGGKCLDLEEMANAESPRKGWVWQKFEEHNVLSSIAKGAVPSSPGPRQLSQRERTDSDLTRRRQSRFAGGLPVGFWLTRGVLIATSILSLLLLVNVTVSKDHSWFILLIGAIGMFQNGVLAGMGLSPVVRNLPLRRREVLRTRKVMDGIMDFYTSYPKLSHSLLREFFPGPLRDAEEKWWNGDFEPYDRLRLDDPTRGTPRRLWPTVVRSSENQEAGVGVVADAAPPTAKEKTVISTTVTAVQ
ncbi:hypothetical protein C8A03DRAFT_18532 [Achaetomium macrosporum]|uniref:Uncharacterized protein n=1 Tax=Achaetomium macrosporum TaxID=79813 RepID=A0AAN7C512_9PEZI|nr:hypothetical protein C8A03DRAFT_18532 [Achaetomium macrosporum]